MKFEPLTACDFNVLTRVTLTCIDCNRAHVSLRDDTSFWTELDRERKLPPVHGTYCTNCKKDMDHFVDWPVKKRRRR